MKYYIFSGFLIRLRNIEDKRIDYIDIVNPDMPVEYDYIPYNSRDLWKPITLLDFIYRGNKEFAPDVKLFVREALESLI